MASQKREKPAKTLIIRQATTGDIPWLALLGVKTSPHPFTAEMPKGQLANFPKGRWNINYAESCILTPCDFPFARDGIAAIAAPHAETLLFADLQLEHPIASRHNGTVQNLKDRRFDLYHVQ